ncbi:uncharacterized protein A1O5_07887 [Cladophialophora psammophila CBS 110553]|uniref:NAD-dependent epimerase/dehydratase domain-containing protein n=1 Tax=Cladophialophora psammophila CBS 110553 TaxID=1182543 RepID=W9WV84_9EURO|nr:uncharacterized protein A1O5_07887 [Cladophialophora psammophila CBS 110553]EXJ68955.1 hypothetical protein A1O5_07887 [Cladophialophora psammophila CBS 110553]
MSHRILVTGASGYLGGTLLARWLSFGLPPYDKLYALVRTDEQANAVKQYGAEPLKFDVKDETAVNEGVVSNRITIVLFLVDALHAESQAYFIRALAEVKKSLGTEVHFMHTSGAKIFSSHAGAPVDRPLLDTDADLYDIQKSQIPPLPQIQPAIDANNTVIELGEFYGVPTYIFVPCIVYGRGEGFGNKISIQTVDITRAAQAARRVYSVDAERTIWPVCHVIDNTTLYLQILASIMRGENPGSGKQGYYLASSGTVAWVDLYSAMATGLAKRGVVDDEVVTLATGQALDAMAAGLGCPPALVPLQLGGMCTFTARHGPEIGWKPQYPAGHILEAADEEVELILANLSK